MQMQRAAVAPIYCREFAYWSFVGVQLVVCLARMSAWVPPTLSRTCEVQALIAPCEEETPRLARVT